MSRDYEHHHHRPPFLSGHHRFHGSGMRFGLGNRARRGDIQIAVLALLDESPMHGYQIIQELAERSGGAWTPSPGSVYPTLQMLEDQGLVVSEQVAGKRSALLLPLRERSGRPPCPTSSHGWINRATRMRSALCEKRSWAWSARSSRSRGPVRPSRSSGLSPC